MRDEDVADLLGNDSPPTRPSTWRLRFGKHSASGQSDRLGSTGEVGTRSDSAPRSPSIAAKLLHALNTKAEVPEATSRECADVLIGRRNAFADEPELRLQVQENELSSPEGNNNQDEDLSAEAKQIIRLRFKIETQADGLRQVPRRKRTKSQPGTRQPTQSRQHPVTPTNTRKTALPAQKRTRKQVTSENVLSSRANAPANKSQPRTILPKQLPMERRRQLLRQARQIRKRHTAEEQAQAQAESCGNNKEDADEQYRLEKQIKRLHLENQEAAALDEKLQRRKVRLQSLSRYFSLWQRLVTYRRQREAKIAAEFNWRLLKRILSSWRRYVRYQSEERAQQHARIALVHEQQKNERAEQLHRLRALPKWFYRWIASVAEQKEQRAVESAAVRRRAQAERLIGKLLRQNSPSNRDCERDHGRQQDDEVGSVSRDSNLENDHPDQHDQPRRHRRTGQAWPPPSADAKRAESETSLEPDQKSKNAGREDPRYRAMERRAAERKQRREELRRRYEQLEQQRREEQEQQRASLEAQALQQKEEQKARLREWKQAEARALHKKQERRDQLITQLREVKRHNRLRLLFYYAFLPWRKHHKIDQRVTRNACRWHELRALYLHWGRWMTYVKMCRQLRRRQERAQLEAAAKYHERCLQRRLLRRWLSQHQLVEARALAVRRQKQWNALQRTWGQWQKRLRNERADQRKRAVGAAFRLQQSQLGRVYVQWRQVTQQSKREKELDCEKQQLWRKVRGWLSEDD